VSDRFVLGVPLGRWQTNCYLVGDRAVGSAVVVDPGETAEQVVPDLLASAGVTCEAILLTHGHLDHLWGVPSLARELDVPVLLHADDRWIWDSPAAAFGAGPELLEAQFGLTWDPPDDHLREVKDGEDVRFAGTTYRVQHNPGHTPGHVTYLGRGLADVPVRFPLGDADRASDDVLFSGDLVFAGAMGRVDFPRGSMDAMMRSLFDTVLPLEDDTLVLSGHGPDTTVGRERATNPYLHEAAARHG
jgi:glyoxylase-like metal-dependent hydrolase (beta-lactamase superfamily II)